MPSAKLVLGIFLFVLVVWLWFRPRRRENADAVADTAQKIDAEPPCSPFVVPGVVEFKHPAWPIRPGHIFVSVASYRDEACKATINDMFDNATSPHLLRVGVVQQNNKTAPGESCFQKCAKCVARIAAGQIVVKDFDYLEAKGPAYARWAASSLFSGEEFYLQVDSHTKFEKGWDAELVSQWRGLHDPRAVIGQYPPTAEQMAAFRKKGYGTIWNCKVNFTAEDFIPVQAAQVLDKKIDHPVPQKYVGAGFLFMPAAAVLEVPFDPYLTFLFFAEEFLYSARLWTAGFNFYAPVRPVATHDYSANPDRPRFWDDSLLVRACKPKSMTRAEFLLGIRTWDQVHAEFRVGQAYGMGTARTLAEYYQFAGVDPKTKTTTNWCA